jgi:hypothetical protein
MSLAPIGRAKDVEWKVSSKKDPRWNKSGKTQGFISMRVYPANKWIKKCKKRYGKPPADLTYQAGALWGNTSRITWFEEEEVKDG